MARAWCRSARMPGSRRLQSGAAPTTGTSWVRPQVTAAGHNVDSGHVQHFLQAATCSCHYPVIA